MAGPLPSAAAWPAQFGTKSAIRRDSLNLPGLTGDPGCTTALIIAVQRSTKKGQRLLTRESIWPRAAGCRSAGGGLSRCTAGVGDWRDIGCGGVMLDPIDGTISTPPDRPLAAICCCRRVPVARLVHSPTNHIGGWSATRCTAAWLAPNLANVLVGVGAFGASSETGLLEKLNQSSRLRHRSSSS